VVLFKNRHGYISGVTSAAVSSYTGADGVHKVHVSSIPVSAEPSVTSRIVCFTVAGADQSGPYFYIPEDDVVDTITITKTIIEDNTTTAIDFNFTDVYLQGSEDITSPQDFFDKIKLPKQANVYYSPSTRRLIWTGGEDDATIFRVSEADDPETYLGSTGFIKPSQNDGERAICAREFRSQLYLFKETAGFLTYNDAANPSDWTVEKRWDRVGPVGPWAVDTSESFMIFLDQSGVYKMDGSIPVCISDEVSSIDSRIWSRINFQVQRKFWVFIDTDLDEIHVGVALDGSTEVNRILKCNYLLGFTPNSRKWSMDTIPSTRMLKIQRNLPACPNPNQAIDPRIAVSQIIHLSANNDGSINLVDPASFVDNGLAIDSKYQTGYHEGEGVLQIGGIGLNARGNGNLQISVLKDQSHRKTITRQLPQDGVLMGEVIKTNGQSPWWALEFANNNVAGAWFEVTRCDLYVRTIYKTRRTRSSGGSSQSSFSLDSESDSEVDGVSSTSNPQTDVDSDCNCDNMPLMLSGPHADRPLATVQIENTEYIETDRGNAKYFVKFLTPCDATTAVWELVVGKMSGTINSPDQKPSDLGVYDKGFEFESSDFSRIFEWTGSVWHDLPGQPVRGVFSLDSAPAENGWHLCDGSTNVSKSLPNGTTTLVTVPNLVGAYPKYGNAFTGAVVAAIAPTLSGSLASHTHTVTPTGGMAGTTGAAGGHNHTFTPSGTIDATLPAHHHVTDPTLVTGGAKTGSLSAWGVTGTVSGNTGIESTPHGHAVDVSGLSVSGSTFGPSDTVNVSTDGISLTAVGSSSHTHGFSSSVSGSAGTGAEDTSHTHDGASLAWSSTTDDHLHQIGELSSGAVFGLPIAVVATFTGSSGTTGSVTDHAHGVGSLAFVGDTDTTSSTTVGLGTLAVSNTGEPVHMVLLPYLKL
jgi:hypothetical protein